MTILGIIPARYNSSRFPGKPLANIQGKTMIQRVYEQAMQADSLTMVIVATDDERIFNHIKSFNGNVVMTSPNHQNGTERCAEALQLVDGKFDAVINIQGDEPFIQPAQIDLVAQCLLEKGTQIATLAKKIERVEEYQNPSIVKVALNNKSEALYFSRSPLPYAQKGITADILKQETFYKHIGIYGFSAAVLKEIVKLHPGKLESIESLEQLRWLENGYRIKVKQTQFDTRAVDTPEDVIKFQISNPKSQTNPD